MLSVHADTQQKDQPPANDDNSYDSSSADDQMFNLYMLIKRGLKYLKAAERDIRMRIKLTEKD